MISGFEIPKKFEKALKNIGATIECPSRIEPSITRFDVKHFGAFSLCGGGGLYARVNSIGRFCSIAPNVVVGADEHKMSALTMSTMINANWNCNELDNYWERNTEFHQKALNKIREKGGRNTLPVSIGNDVWIGAGAVIRRGVHVGDGAVVGANSVVSQDVLPYEIVQGVPAESKRFRFDPDTVAMLVESAWWQWSLASLDAIPFHDPVRASKELARRKSAGSYELARYEIASWVE